MMINQFYTNAQILLSSFDLYSSMFRIGMVAVPESIAAWAMSGHRVVIKRGSNGVGIRYSGPNYKSALPVAFLTSSGTGYLARLARDLAVVSFISSLISFDRVSRVALNKNGKHMTLLIWFG